MQHAVSSLVERFQLIPHPEGGYYKETYRSGESMPQTALPGRFTGSRCFSTAIYFLLEEGNFSAFHCIKSDECWHFYSVSFSFAGCTVSPGFDFADFELAKASELTQQFPQQEGLIRRLCRH